MSKKNSALTIGRLAKAANVNIETVRHYQRQDLITEPKKPAAGFRHYPTETVDRIRFIKRAQQLGFSLKEISQLLLLGGQHCDEIQILAELKLVVVKEKIAGLRHLEKALKELLVQCHSNDDDSQCPIIDSLQP